MNKPFITAFVLTMLISCHGGNMNSGEQAGADSSGIAGNDSVNASAPSSVSNGDSANGSAPSHIDTSAAALPTDTALYKRKPDSSIDNRMHKTDRSGMNKKN